MRSFLFIPLFILIGMQGFAQEHISLNGIWHFALAKTTQEADGLADFHSSRFNTKKFTSIPVPSNWAVLGFEEPVYRGFKDDKASEGFYLREFILPKDWKDKRVLLHFGGVWSSAEIWLNGIHLGQHNSGYTSFAFDITGKLNAESTNRLAVRVRQVSREYKFDVFDDWTLGGIYRDITLEAMPINRWMDRVVVQTSFDNQFKDADLKISTMVSDKHKSTLPGNYPSPGEPYDLRFTLSDKEGNEVARRQITIPAHTATDREVSLTLRVESPHHWTAETPYLYNLRVDLLEKDKPAHTWKQRIGFRQISTEGGIFRINGQAVKLRGVNRHDEHPDVGRATTREHWLQDIKLMKAANINYIRMAHYTHAKGFIELCDELGMYVGNEISLGGAGNSMYDPSYSGAVLVRSYETVVRDINSPSIVYWSIGNEDPLTSLHLASVKLVKALDPTRPVLIPWRSEGWLPEEIDILSSHYWQPDEYDRWAGQANRPVITTEYTHSYGVDGFGGLEARWKALTKHPSGTGAAIWMWADQGIKTPVRNPKGKTSFNQGDEYLRIDEAGWDGIVDSYRNPTQDYLETKAVYAQVYPVVNKITFTPGEASARIPIQNEFDFTDLNSINISWSVREDEQELDSGSGSVSGIPHTVATFELPVRKLNTIKSGKTYYARFIFSHADGTEINRKTVELYPLIKPRQQVSPIRKLLVKNEKDIVIEAGEVSYTFSTQTGHLSLATLRKKPLITDLRPTIWRTPDQSEVSVIGRKIVHEAADLNQYTPSVKTWNLEETDDEVIIRAIVEYTVNKNNRFTTTYRYSVGTNGQLHVHYEILPEVEMPCVPMVGMSLRSTPGLNDLRWLGLGPYDAYPNKQSASILGVWGGTADECTGNKATRWIERSGQAGKVRISNMGYMNYEKETPNTVHILSGVLGRPEKGRKADESVPQLRTDTGKPFIGEFNIEMLGSSCGEAPHKELPIPTADKVGAHVMPANIEPTTNAPFDMPSIQPFIFPDLMIDIVQKGAQADLPITSIVNQAIDEMNVKGGGTVVIPEGEWTSGRIELKSNVKLHLSKGATLVFSSNPEDYSPPVFTRHEGVEVMAPGAFIYANGQQNIAVTGQGTIYGPPLDADIRNHAIADIVVEKVINVHTPVEERIYDGMDGRRMYVPKTISPVNCKNVLIEGVTLNRSLFWNICPVYCENVIIRGVTVNSVGIPSGDGIDIESCKNVLIEYCTLNNGDDCFTIKAGRCEDGLRVGKPSENIIIRYSLAQAGDGGITCGSETAGGIKNLYAHDCVFNETRRGIRFKTRRNRGGGVENAHYERIRMIGVIDAFTWDLLGTEKYMGELAKRYPSRKIDKLTPVIKDIFVKDIIVESAQYFIRANGIPEIPLDNVLIEKGDIHCDKVISAMDDVTNFKLKDLNINTQYNNLEYFRTDIKIDNVNLTILNNTTYKIQ